MHLLYNQCSNTNDLLLVGAKPTLAFGGVGYAVYAASFLCYNHTENRPFVIFAGALLGVCAALLWCAQGTIMMVCPSPCQKKMRRR
jgi:hypothetical protein